MYKRREQLKKMKERHKMAKAGINGHKILQNESKLVQNNIKYDQKTMI